MGMFYFDPCWYRYCLLYVNIFVVIGGDPDKFWWALPRDVPTRGVPLDDAKDQTHGRALG